MFNGQGGWSLQTSRNQTKPPTDPCCQMEYSLVLQRANPYVRACLGGLEAGRTPRPAGHRNRKAAPALRRDPGPGEPMGFSLQRARVGLGSATPPPVGQGFKVGGCWASLQRSLLPSGPRSRIQPPFNFFSQRKANILHIFP